MLFKTMGEKENPAVLFFHAMGVTGASSERVARFMADKYFCIMPTSTVCCGGQKYIGKDDEVRQIEEFLKSEGVKELSLVAASSIGADLALYFLTKTKIPVGRVFFDGGQFAEIGKSMRRVMTPFLYLAIKSVYLSKGKTLGKIMWCSDDSIKPYFIAAGKALKYRNLRRQLGDSLEDKPFPPLSEDFQRKMIFEFGSAEEHFKYRGAVMKAYPFAEYPIFEGFNHMQLQIKDPMSFAKMMCSAAEGGSDFGKYIKRPE